MDLIDPSSAIQRRAKMTLVMAALLLMVAGNVVSRGQVTSAIIDIAGVWENEPEFPNSRIYRLELERVGTTNTTFYTDFAYTGNLLINYSTRLPAPNGGQGEMIHCTVPYVVSGWVRMPYAAPGYLMRFQGTNFVQILPGEPLVPRTIYFDEVNGALSQDLKAGRLQLDFSYQDRRGDPWDPNTVDVCGTYLHQISVFDYPILRRLPVLPTELQAKFTLSGTVKSLLPTLTEEEYAVHRARLTVYEQAQAMRPKGATESAEEYQGYLATERSRRRAVAAAQLLPEDGGRFSFPDLPVFKSVIRNGSGTHEFGYYTLEAEFGETDEWILQEDGTLETNRTEILYFASNELRNIAPHEEERVLELRPFDGISAKESLARQLMELGPKNYKSAEERVLAYLEVLKQTNDRTPEALEGLRRALWAERVVRDAASNAKELNGAMLDGFAALVGDLLEDVSLFTRKGLREREARMEQIDDLGIEDAVQKGFSTPTREMLMGELHHLRQNSLGILSDVFKHFKAATDSLLFAAKAVVIEQGMGQEEATEAIDQLGAVLNTILNAFITQGTGTLSEPAKALIKRAQDSLFDGPGFSFTGRTGELLDFAESNLVTWAQADEAAYLASRDRATEVLEKIGGESAFALQVAHISAGLSDGISAGESAMESLNFIPAAKWSEVILKVAKYVNNLALFGVPARMVIYSLPKYAEEGVHGAFGDFGQAQMGVAEEGRLQTASFLLTTINSRLSSHVSSTNSAINSRLNAMALRLQTNGLLEALNLAAGTNATTLPQLEQGMHEAVDLVVAHSAGSTNFLAHDRRTRLLVARAEASAALYDINDKLFELVADVYSGKFVSPSDPRYVARRYELIALLKAGPKLIDAYYLRADALMSMSPRVFPVAAVVSLTASSVAGTNVFSSSPEEFTFRARLRNVSTWSVPSMTAELRIEGGDGTEFLTPATVAVPSLDWDDYAANTGRDETNISWTVRLSGAVTNSTVFQAEVVLREKGAAPASFRSYTQPILVRGPENDPDQDGDGMLDEFERGFGLNVGENDARADKDGDGITNEREYFFNTAPNAADTDSDGLSDLEEATAGEDGYITSATAADSDEDGILDGVDAAPTAAEEAGVVNGRELQVSPSVITLSSAQPFAEVSVSADSPDTRWSAIPAEEYLVNVIPRYPNTGRDGNLLISFSGNFDASAPFLMVTSVKVAAANAGLGATKEVLVVINGTAASPAQVDASFSGGSLTLRWRATEAGTFQVQYSDRLSGWTSAANGELTATAGQELSWTDSGYPATATMPVSVRARFYRVVAVKRN